MPKRSRPAPRVSTPKRKRGVEHPISTAKTSKEWQDAVSASTTWLADPSRPTFRCTLFAEENKQRDIYADNLP